ncbi:GNAT family N-acetyltransferase [Smaragdicoccus niigatensis]|uniref:bifunctional acetate--CoA ligase family protein/GNAT family N-acetyltransferase n=1 Tax=Smaragdicoccus niigatensis TaxID=359359 RepID=UPI000380A6F2
MTVVTEQPPFPEHWLADVLASDGGVVHLRPITPDDAERLVAFHSRLSDETRYLRYFGPYPTLSEQDVYRATHVDHRNRVALISQLGDDIIAVGLYEANADGSAEVAFVVADEHQGRGLGSILLEHLAGAAAENGIDTFVAEVLARNRAMVKVFLDAGYQVTRTLEQSVLHLEFAIDPTEALLQVRNSRESASEARSVRNLLSPSSIAVIGASVRPEKVGGAILANLLAGQFNGPVYPVNELRRSVQGVRAYPTVHDIPDTVDLAIIAVPAADIDAVFADCLAKGVKGVVILSAGFAESGEHGFAAQQRLARQARVNGMRLVGPNALGIANTNPEVALNGTLAAGLPRRGRAGFFCQSGPLGSTILREAAARGLGLSTFVSAGNRADVSGNDLIQYWDADSDTDVVLLYLETLGNARKFARIAKRLARNKPIILVRSGRLGRPDPAASAIDATIAADLFRQAGVIAVDSISDLFDCATLMCHQPLPAGRRIAVVGNSEALAWPAIFAAESGGLEVTRTEVLSPTADADAFDAALREIAAAADVDAVVAIVVPPVPIPMEQFAASLRSVAAVASKPIVSTFAGEQGIPDLLAVRDDTGAAIAGSVPSYSGPEHAVRAIQRAWEYAQWRAEPVSTPIRPSGIDSARAGAILASRAPGWLSDRDAADLFGSYGVPIVDFREVDSAEAAESAADELGLPVAVKATGEVWRHRPDLRGVRLDLGGPAGVRRAYEDLAEASGNPLVHVQKMAVKGIGCVIRVQEDPAFGPVVSFGLSGVMVDLLGDRAYRSLPLSLEDAAALVAAPKTASLLLGTPTTEAADTASLADLLVRISTLCEDFPQVRELVLEPILASRSRTEVLYGRVRVGPEPTQFDAGPRRLA